MTQVSRRTKPFSIGDENVLKQSAVYLRSQMKTGMANMQFILDLLWEQSCSRYLASLVQQEVQQ